MKVCVIGAGSSGITVCKTLKDYNIDFDCFEKGSAIGGNWRYMNDNGMSAAYRSLHINTSRFIMAYSDFPMPESYPDYPSHLQIIEYFENYVDHFQFREKIKFRTSVEEVNELENGKYEVITVSDLGQTKVIYDAVFVCNGHHWNKRYPNFPGTFTGRSIHAHEYKTFDGYEDKRVLVIGIGNSATDIAVELTRVARKVVVSTRSGAYIIPKYILGIPTDQFAHPIMFKLPFFLQQFFSKIGLMLSVGNQKKYGVPIPNRPMLSEHPTISQDLLSYAGHGKISFKPNIKELKGRNVLFEDDTAEEFDEIIYCTGYNITFPFFKQDFLKVENNNIQLYKRVLHPKHPNLFFIGLVQPLGAIMPLAEIQAKWSCQILSGKIRLPSLHKMEEDIQRTLVEQTKRYNSSPRHTIQVDFYPYKWMIEKELHKK
jgi:thioredoxin reductase